jgi:hypothetical protein
MIVAEPMPFTKRSGTIFEKLVTVAIIPERYQEKKKRRRIMTRYD